ncbi:GNAT family N-acetyltransferase [Bacillus spongiae]|uniref:GNAT family N-acetyltransferase n=1 Tax=Bacillus spongiae TaxID=2683610 RepID=A0ABU8HED3_9BACI
MIIRKAQSSDGEGIAKVHVESWQTTYQGILPQSYLSTLDVDNKIKMWRNILAHSHHTYVAECEGRIVGFASFGKGRTNIADAELYAIYLLQTHQKKKIGQKLLHYAISILLSEGYKSLFTWVVNENSSIQFYKKLQGDLIKEKQVEIGGKLLIETAIVWEDLQQLQNVLSID